MKGYTVFNVKQIDGLPAQYRPAPSPALPALALHQAAEGFFAATGATVHHGGNRAFYAPVRDFIQLPPAKTFKDARELRRHQGARVDPLDRPHQPQRPRIRQALR